MPPLPRVTRLVLTVVVLLVSALFGASPSNAQIIRPAPDAEPDTVPRTLITTFSGGISLGAYQAGVNWVMMDVVRTGQREPEFRTSYDRRDLRFGAAAGASAGNINAILWAIEACSTLPPRQGPEASLFWKAWMPVGIDSLLRGPYERGDELAVLDRRFFEVVQDSVESRMSGSGFRSPCQVPIGITLTRIVPDTLRLRGGSGLEVRSQRFVTVMLGETEVDTAGTQAGESLAAPMPSGASRFVFHPLASDKATDKSLGLVRLAGPDSTMEIPSGTLFSIVRASSAFPIAFAPVELSMYDPVDGRNTKELFMDGGVFDNNPIHLANILQSWYGEQVQAGRARLQGPKATRLLYVDPDVRRNASQQHATVRPLARGGLRPVFQMLGGAVHSAREYELHALSRYGGGQQAFDPVLTTRYFPVVGERMSAFGAFLNRGFREYDFYVGVYDGLYALTTNGYLTTDTIFSKNPCGRHRRIDELAGAIGLPAHARVFIRRLASEEHPCGTVLPPLELSPSQRVREAFYETVLEAHRMDPPSETVACSGRGLPDWLLCVGRMEGFLAAVQQRVPALYGYYEACQVRNSGSIDSSVRAVWAELEMCALAQQAAGPRMQVLLERVLARLPAVEREVTQQLPGRNGHGLEIATEVAAFIYHSGLRPRSGLQWGNLPAEASTAWALVPAYFGMDGDGSAVEVGWQPTYYLHNRSGVGVGLTGLARLNWYTDRSGARSTWQTDYYGMLGLGPRLTYRVGGAFGLLLSRLEVSGNATTRGPLAEVAVGLFADRVRVGFRGMIGEDDLGDEAGTMFQLGFNDLNGLLYWGKEMVRH